MKLGIAGIVLGIGSLVACANWPNAKTIPDAVMTTEMLFCIYDHSSDPVAQIMQECNVPQDLLQDVVDAQMTAAAHKAGMHRCAGDGGACSAPGK